MGLIFTPAYFETAKCGECKGFIVLPDGTRHFFLTKSCGRKKLQTLYEDGQLMKEEVIFLTSAINASKLAFDLKELAEETGIPCEELERLEEDFQVLCDEIHQLDSSDENMPIN